MSRPRLLITSGPTREYLDPVRYLSNGSSGQMGYWLAMAAIEVGYDVMVVSGPVSIRYPASATVVDVESTQQMHDAVIELWPSCIGMIAAAAPCDFRPREFSHSKIKKSSASGGMSLDLIANPDILAEVGQLKTRRQWTVGFALETENGIEHAREKRKRKGCDLIVLNSPSAIDSAENSISIINQTGKSILEFSGTKQDAAKKILEMTPPMNLT